LVECGLACYAIGPYICIYYIYIYIKVIYGRLKKHGENVICDWGRFKQINKTIIHIHYVIFIYMCVVCFRSSVHERRVEILFGMQVSERN